MLAARLGAFWFGIQAVWTAMLGVVLQDRASALAAHGAPAASGVGAYAVLAVGGACVASVVQIVAGIASDRHRARRGDRRAFYRAGVAIAAPAIVLVCAAPSFAALACAVFALQIGMNVAGGPYQAIVTDYVASDALGRASSWMSVCQFLGSVTGLVLTILLHGAPLGVVLACALAASWFVTDRTVRGLSATSTGSAPFRLDRASGIVLVSRGAINVGFYTLFGFLYFFVRESLGVADARTTTGILFLVFTVAAVAGAAAAGPPADRFDKRVVISVACLTIALSVGAFAAARSVGVAIACAAASGAAWGAFFTVDWAIAYALLPREAMAAAMGVWNLAAAVPQVLAPAITAPLVAYGDARYAGAGPRAALACVIVEFALGTAWLWRLRAHDLSIGAQSVRTHRSET